MATTSPSGYRRSGPSWPTSASGSRSCTPSSAHRPTGSDQIAALVQRVRTVTPEQWFLVGFVLLFVAYAVVLITAPVAVGRGGR